MARRYPIGVAGPGYPNIGGTRGKAAIVEASAALTSTHADRQVYPVSSASALTNAGGPGATAPVALSGTYTDTATAIQARTVDYTSGVEVTPWTTVAASPIGGVWSGTLAMKEYNGWQRLQVRLGVSGAAQSISGARVGAGLLIGVEGQSQARYFVVNVNSGGSVTAGDLVSVYGSDGLLEATSSGNGATSNFGGVDWYAASANTTKNGNLILGGGSSGAAAMGNQLVSTLGVPVAFIAQAPGGRRIDEINSTSHKPFIQARYAEAGRPHFVLLMSHGTADVDIGTTEANYLAQLNIWKAWHDADANAAPRTRYLVVPLVRQASANSSTNVRRATNKFIEANNRVVKYAAGGYDVSLDDSVHVNDAGNAYLGRRLAVAALRELGITATGTRGPTIASVTRSAAVLTVAVAFADGATALTTAATGSTGGLTLPWSAVLESSQVALTVSSVVVNSTTITVTLSADPGGPVRLFYGLAQNSGANAIVDNAPASGDTRGAPLRYEMLGVLEGAVAPAQVTGLVVTPGDTRNSLAWAAPASGVPISDYLIEVSTNGGSSWSTVADGTSPAADYVHTGLTNGTTYTYRVSAISAAGTGTASATAAGVPAAPVTFTLSTAGRTAGDDLSLISGVTRIDGASGGATVNASGAIDAKNTTTAGVTYQVSDLKSPSMYIEAVVALATGSFGPVLALWMSDFNNWVGVRWSATNAFELVQNLAGTKTVLYNGYGVSPAVNQVVRLATTSSGVVTLYTDGVKRGSDIVVTAIPASTFAGLVARSTNKSPWINSGVVFSGVGPEAVSPDPIYGPDIISNGTFATDTVWTKGTGWTIGSGVATKAVSAGSNLTQPVTLVAGASYLVTYDLVITAIVGAGFSSRFVGDTTVLGAFHTTSGSYSDVLVAPTGVVTLGFRNNATGDAGTVDNVTCRRVL